MNEFNSHRITNNYTGLDIKTDKYLLDIEEDWSRVRSPARAKRRLKQGHKQNVDIVYVPSKSFYKIGNTIYCHPETYKKLQKRIKEVMDKAVADNYATLMHGVAGGNSDTIIKDECFSSRIDFSFKNMLRNPFNSDQLT